MKAARASCEGYLTLRTSPSSPPPMLRRYCFLVGTSLYYYSTQEDAHHMQRLKGQVTVLGVQEWDGKGNMHIYQNGFLFATAQNKVFYAYADTAMEKEKWIRAIQMIVETIMDPVSLIYSPSHRDSDCANPLRPSVSISGSDIQSPLSCSAVTDSEILCRCRICKTSEEIIATILFKCHNCEEMYCEKFTTNKIPLVQKSYYNSKRVCDYCFDAQMYLNYLNAILERLKVGICIYPMPLNPKAPIELIMPKRPNYTEAANIAIDMFKIGLISAEECEEILLCDRRYLKNTLEHPEIPLDLKILALHREFRTRGFSVFRNVILLHRHLDSDPLLFKPIVEKLLHFSYTRINQVEFYWPQIVHAYLNVPTFDFEKLFWLDELILSICSRSIHLALLLRWQLQGALEDAFDITGPKEMQDKYARVVRLMVEMEKEVLKTDRDLLLSADLEKTSLKNRLPVPTKDQLSIIEELTEGIIAMKNEKHAQANLKRYSIDLGNKLEMQDTYGADGDNDSRFREFSRFQQHLLTPREDPSLDILLGQSFSSNDAIDDIPPSSIIEEDMMDNQPTSIFTSGFLKQSHPSEQSVLAQYFADECNFVEQITDIAEKLRSITAIPDRKRMLPSFLEKIKIPPMAYVPLVKATDPFERIVRIPRDEGTAFSTKSRVPLMLIFEVIRGEFFDATQIVSPHLTSPEGAQATAVAVEYPDEEELGQMMHEDHNSKLYEEEEVIACAAILPELKLDVPETPAAVDGLLETPRSTLTKMKNFEEFDRDTYPNSNSLIAPSMKLTKEALERENDRKKDLEAAFGESWSSKRQRLRASSPFGHLEGWDIVSMIGKSNDDLRQEVFSLQLIQKFIDIFKSAKLPIWLKSYRIIATSSSTGLIETLANAISLDGLKKREGYISLLHHFEKSYGPVQSRRFYKARSNFIQSMAGYSIVCYLLQIKDRHNGNIMLDNAGHIIHIDYGFLLGIAPGGSFSIETAPFKLTSEMVDTMGGADSDGYKEYITLCTRYFLACQHYCDDICDFVDIMSRQSPYPCFVGKDVGYILLKLRSRFKRDLPKQDVIAHVLSLVRKSNSNYSTRQYDNFQRMTNGILP